MKINLYRDSGLHQWKNTSTISPQHNCYYAIAKQTPYPLNLLQVQVLIHLPLTKFQKNFVECTQNFEFWENFLKNYIR